MAKLFTIIFLTILSQTLFANQYKTIHIFVALADHRYQGIPKLPNPYGDGNNPKGNLYWGARDGAKTHFMKSKNWKFIKKLKPQNGMVLERLLFKHSRKPVYLLAEAYRG